MNVGPINKAFFRSLASLTILVVFLLLGFCPLRNTLVTLVKTVPAKETRKVPERAKIIAADDCTASTSTTQKIASSREPMPSGNTLGLPTVFIPQVAYVRWQRLKLPVAFITPPILIYLRNQVLLI